MRALRLSFVRHPRSLRGVGYVLLVLAIATASYLMKVYLDQFSELESWEAKWRSLQKIQYKEISGNPNQNVEWARLQVELKGANKIIGRLSLPWDMLFHEVEASVDELVVLLNVEPDTERHGIRITAEAKNLEAMLNYTKRLQAVDAFKYAHIANHQIQQQDAQKPVRFVVEAQWVELLR